MGAFFVQTFDNLDEPLINQDPQGDLAQDYHIGISFIHYIF